MPFGRPVTVRVSGVAKGVGMIHPQMATMLSVILTDANVAPEVLWPLLRPAAARTWNQLSVDGDTSTNDTVLVLASGVAGAAPAEDGSAAAATLGACDRGDRPRPGAPAGGRWRGRQHADHGRGHAAHGTTPRPGRSPVP